METITPEDLLLVFEGKKRVPINRLVMDTCAILAYCPDILQVLRGKEPDMTEYERLEAALRKCRKVEGSDDLVGQLALWEVKLGHLMRENSEHAEAIERVKQTTTAVREALKRRVRDENLLTGSITYVVESMAGKVDYKNSPPDHADIRIAGHALGRWLERESVALVTADEGLGNAYIQAAAALREHGGENIRALMQAKPLVVYFGRHRRRLEYDIITASEAELEKEVDKECEIQIKFVERKLE